MTNECPFCGVRHIETNTVVLNDGQMWVEFCEYCGERHVLHNEKGGCWLVRELFASAAAHASGVEYVRQEQDIHLALHLALREHSEGISPVDYDEWSNALWEREQELVIPLEQLQADWWDQHEYRCLHSQKHQSPRYLV